MTTMRIIYYGFGAFVGFVCGTVINLIFYWVEQSGNPIASNLGRNYGVYGAFLAEMINFLPFFGVALGIVMVRMLFQEQWDREEED